MKSLLLRPAYGRKYDTPEAAEKDWKDGKDFQIVNGPYCSIRDTEDMGYNGNDSVTLIYAKGSIQVAL